MATVIGAQTIPPNGCPLNGSGNNNALSGTSGDSTGMSFSNTGAELLLIDNVDTAATTVTISFDSGASCVPCGDDIVVIVPADKCSLVGPFRPELYSSGGSVSVSIIAETTTAPLLSVIRKSATC